MFGDHQTNQYIISNSFDTHDSNGWRSNSRHISADRCDNVDICNGLVQLLYFAFVYVEFCI